MSTSSAIHTNRGKRLSTTNSLESRARTAGDVDRHSSGELPNSAAYQLCMALPGATPLCTGLFLGWEIRTAQERVCEITVASKASIQAQLEGKKWRYLYLLLAALINKLQCNINPTNFP